MALALALAATTHAQEQKANPPPEFTSGYEIPHTPAPLPRAEMWGMVDVLVLVLVLALGARGLFQKRSRTEMRMLALFAVGYFGFYRLGCVCSIGSIQNVTVALTTGSSLPWVVAAFFAIPLAAALFFGRIFCGSACPMGAVQDLLLLKPMKVPGWVSGPLGAVPYLFLGTAILYAATGTAFIICQADPFVPFFRLNGPGKTVAFGAAVLALSVFVGRPYCRFLCPYGVLLRWASLVSKHRVRITPTTCVNCHLCAEACPFDAIEPPSAGRPVSRRQIGLLVAAVPILVLVFALLGTRLAPTMASGDARVLRAYELMAEPAKPGVLKRAESWHLQGKENDLAIAEGQKVLRQFETGAPILGAWFGLVIGLRALLLARKTRRTDYEAEPGACLSCARCYAACPVEANDRFTHLGNLIGGTSR